MQTISYRQGYKVGYELRTWSRVSFGLAVTQMEFDNDYIRGMKEGYSDGKRDLTKAEKEKKEKQDAEDYWKHIVEEERKQKEYDAKTPEEKMGKMNRKAYEERRRLALKGMQELLESPTNQWFRKRIAEDWKSLNESKGKGLEGNKSEKEKSIKSPYQSSIAKMHDDMRQIKKAHEADKQGKESKQNENPKEEPAQLTLESLENNIQDVKTMDEEIERPDQEIEARGVEEEKSKEEQRLEHLNSLGGNEGLSKEIDMQR